MKYITMKKSILSRVVLLASLITVTAIHSSNSENETAMQDFGAFVYAVDKNISDFCSQNNKTPFDTYVTALEKLFYNFKRKVEALITRGNNDVLAKDIQDLIDYSLRQFDVAYGIIKKYNGKSANEALTFGTEIKRDFNTEKVFGEILAKLKVLKCKATQANENDLAKRIEIIITMIEKKRKDWNAKSDFTLIQGLSYRMNCK